MFDDEFADDVWIQKFDEVPSSEKAALIFNLINRCPLETIDLIKEILIGEEEDEEDTEEDTEEDSREDRDDEEEEEEEVLEVVMVEDSDGGNEDGGNGSDEDESEEGESESEEGEEDEGGDDENDGIIDLE
ncbi:2811_t:CDS:2, partial [Entrophospora sp. SA101]